MVGDDPQGVAAAENTGSLSDDESASGASPLEGKGEKLSAEQKAMLKDQSRWLLKQPYFAKLAIVVAGPLFNVLTAWLLAIVFVYSYGIQTGPVLAGPYVGFVVPEQPAAKAGVKVGDKILSVNEKAVENWEQLADAVQNSGGAPIKLAVLRSKGELVVDPNTARIVNLNADSEQIEITANPTNETSVEDSVLGLDKTSRYKIGIQPPYDYRTAGLWESVQRGSLETYGAIWMTVVALKKIATFAVNPTAVVRGPLTIVQQIGESAQVGVGRLVRMVMFLNIMLAIMNLLPPLSPRMLEVATQIGLCLLLALMVFAVHNDIVSIFL
jgi:regulator of sigma E protease